MAAQGSPMPLPDQSLPVILRSSAGLPEPRKCGLRTHEHDAVGDGGVHARRVRQGVGWERPRRERRAERVEERTLRPADAVDRDRGRELKVGRIDAAFG